MHRFLQCSKINFFTLPTGGVSMYDAGTGFWRIDWISEHVVCLDVAEVTVGVVRVVGMEVIIGGFCMGNTEVGDIISNITATRNITCIGTSNAYAMHTMYSVRH
eukprot:1962475-Ditylum_brightwellii.AAC.1